MHPFEQRVREIASCIENTTVVVEEDEVCIIHACCSLDTDNSKGSCVTRAFVDAEFTIVFSHFNPTSRGTGLYLVYRVKPPSGRDEWS